MLKKVFLNGKKIPVPVPIRTVAEAMAWVETHLMKSDHTITRVQLDGLDIEGLGIVGQKWPDLPLDEASDLRCKVDSPSDICIQTLDALKHLSGVVSRNLKPLAVLLWEYKGAKLPPEAKTVFEDIILMQELLEHLLLLLDQRVDATNCLSLKKVLNQAWQSIELAEAHCDWKALAKILLNRLEDPLCEMASELASVQKTVFEIHAERLWEKKQTSKEKRPMIA